MQLAIMIIIFLASHSHALLSSRLEIMSRRRSIESSLRIDRSRRRNKESILRSRFFNTRIYSRQVNKEDSVSGWRSRLFSISENLKM